MSSNFSIKLQFARSFVVEIPFIFMWARANQSLVGWQTLLLGFLVVRKENNVSKDMNLQ